MWAWVNSPPFWRNASANAFSILDFKDFTDSHRGSWKQPDFAIRSMNLTLPNLVIETAFSQGDESVQRNVELWLEGTRGLVQVVIIVKMREGPIPEDGGQSFGEDGSSSSMSGNGDSDSERSAVSPGEALNPEDDLLVGPITVSIELWRRGNGVYLDHILVSLLSHSEYY